MSDNKLIPEPQPTAYDKELERIVAEISPHRFSLSLYVEALGYPNNFCYQDLRRALSGSGVGHGEDILLSSDSTWAERFEYVTNHILPEFKPPTSPSDYHYLRRIANAVMQSLVDLPNESQLFTHTYGREVAQKLLALLAQSPDETRLGETPQPPNDEPFSLSFYFEAIGYPDNSRYYELRRILLKRDSLFTEFCAKISETTISTPKDVEYLEKLAYGIRCFIKNPVRLDDIDSAQQAYTLLRTRLSEADQR